MRDTPRNPQIYQVTKAATEMLLRAGDGGRAIENQAKAAATTITGTGLVIDTEASAFDQAMAEYSAFYAILDDAGFQRLPFHTRIVTLGADMTASLVGEGEAMPVQQADLKGRTLIPEKAAGAIVVSNEFIDAESQLESFVSRNLRAAVGKAVDTAVFAALTNGVTPSADLATALGVVNHGAESALRLIVDPAEANALALADPTGEFSPTRGGVYRGIRTYVSAGITGTIIIDARRIGANAGAIGLKRSDAGTMQLADPVTNDSATPTASTLVSLFQTNCVAIAGIAEFGVGILRDDAVATVAAA